MITIMPEKHSKLTEILDKHTKINEYWENDFRSFHLLKYVEELLEERVEHKIILDILKFVYEQPCKTVDKFS